MHKEVYCSEHVVFELFAQRTEDGRWIARAYQDIEIGEGRGDLSIITLAEYHRFKTEEAAMKAARKHARRAGATPIPTENPRLRFVASKPRSHRSSASPRLKLIDAQHPQ